MERLDVDRLATEWQIGSLALKDILQSLARPSRDPREDLPPPIFRRGIMKLEDLSAGMELSGTVLNVVDFGVFVDIGLSDSALIHISRLADKFIRDPHEVVGIGDVLKVWVVDVDKQRRRVSLTAIQPGSEKPRESREARGGRRGGERGGERGGPGGDGVAAGRPSGGRTGQRGGPGGAAAGRGPGGATGRFGGAGQGGRPGGDRGPGGAGPSARGGGPGGDRFSGRPGGRPQMGPGAGSGGERDAAQAGGRGPRGGEAGRGGGRPGRGGGGAGAGGGGFTRPPQKPKPSQPSRPITQNMMEGKEPMRAFSDLLQFYQKKKDDDGETDKRGG
ncbi:MAG: S1 RNA-binding domain-containing protein [Planctomycetota bacterium]